MKALSLRQPWALAVLHYGKTLENRRWNTRFRGEFLIHAAKGMTGAEYEEGEDFIADTLGDLRLPPGEHPCASLALRDAARAEFAADFKLRGHRGGIVGRARLVDVIPPCIAHPSELPLFDECPHPWHIPEQYAFVLEDVTPLAFVPWKGELQFFEVPDDYATRAR